MEDVLAFRALRHPNYRLFYAGQIVSLAGSWMQQVAQAWLIYRLTGSAFLLGLISFANRAPVLFLSMPVGVWADRLDRRKIILYTQAFAAVQALLLAAMTHAELIDTWSLVFFALFLGIITAVDLPVRQAFVADLVPVEDMPSAVGLNSTAVNLARVAGPAAAGLVIAAWGEAFCFLINAVSFIAVLLALLNMRPIERPATPAGKPAFWAELSEGIRYVSGHRRIGLAMLMVANLSFLGLPYLALMPIIVAERLHGGAQTLGWLMALGGAGAVTAGLFLAGLKEKESLLRWVFLSSLVLGGGLLGLGSATSFAPAAAALFFISLGTMLALAAANTFLQMFVEPSFRGRVMSIYSVAFMGLAPLGGLVAGVVAERYPAHVVIVGTGVMILLSTLLLGGFFRRRPAS